MKVLVFDTETTGLPKSRYSDPINAHEFPHIVQLSYIIYDTERGSLLGLEDNIVCVPEGVIISEKCVSIHGITTEISLTKGITIKYALEKFMANVSKVDLIVGHNIEFDLKMILAEFMRMNDIVSFQMLQNFKQFCCTMQEGTDRCNLVSFDKNGKPYTHPKFPNLGELHFHLFETTPQKLHNSLNDVVICLRCFHKLKYDTDICTINLVVGNMVDLIV